MGRSFKGTKSRIKRQTIRMVRSKELGKEQVRGEWAVPNRRETTPN